MKNTVIATILFFCSTSLHAQSVIVKSDSFFEFKHHLNISTDEAVETKNYDFVKSGVGTAEFIFNDSTKTVHITFYNGAKDTAIIDSMSTFDNGEINYFVTWPKTQLNGYYSLSTLRKRNVLWCGFYYSDNTMGVWSSVVKSMDIKN